MLAHARRRLEERARAARRFYVVDLLWRSFRDFQRQDGATSAAAISYYVLFSLFPLLIFIVAVFGYFIRDAELQRRVVNVILEQFPSETNLDAQVESVVEGVAGTDIGVFGVIGLVGTVWTATGMFGALRRALNRAFDVAGTESFFRGKAIDLLSVVGVIGMAVLTAATNAALGTLRIWANDLFRPGLPDLLWRFSSTLVLLALSLLTFVVMYGVVPNRRPGGKDLWIGALIAAFGFEVAKAGFRLYLARFGNYQEVYGALGGIAATLVFVFVMASIVIFAAEVTSELVKDRAARSRS